MPIGAAKYSRRDLPASHVKALDQAFRDLADAFFEDVAELVSGAAFEDTSMIDFVPRQSLPRYDREFAQRFLACLLTVAWKQRSPHMQGARRGFS